MIISNEPYEMTRDEHTDYQIGRFVETLHDYAEKCERDGDDSTETLQIAEKWEHHISQ
jgi:hypothetical protein